MYCYTCRDAYFQQNLLNPNEVPFIVDVEAIKTHDMKHSFTAVLSYKQDELDSEIKKVLSCLGEDNKCQEAIGERAQHLSRRKQAYDEMVQREMTETLGMPIMMCCAEEGIKLIKQTVKSMQAHSSISKRLKAVCEEINTLNALLADLTGLKDASVAQIIEPVIKPSLSDNSTQTLDMYQVSAKLFLDMGNNSEGESPKIRNKAEILMKRDCDISKIIEEDQIMLDEENAVVEENIVEEEECKMVIVENEVQNGGAGLNPECEAKGKEDESVCSLKDEAIQQIMNGSLNLKRDVTKSEQDAQSTRGGGSVYNYSKRHQTEQSWFPSTYSNQNQMINPNTQNTASRTLTNQTKNLTLIKRIPLESSFQCIQPLPKFGTSLFAGITTDNFFVIMNIADEKRTPVYRLDLNYGRNADLAIEEVSTMVITREFLFFIATLSDFSQALCWYEFMQIHDTKTGRNIFMICRSRSLQSVKEVPLRPVELAYLRDPERNEHLYVLDSLRGPFKINLETAGDTLDLKHLSPFIGNRPRGSNNGSASACSLTCMCGRYSNSQKGMQLYVGTTNGCCHLINCDSGEIMKSFRLFHKARPIQQLLLILDLDASGFYIVASQKCHRKIALLHEFNHENPVKHFKFQDKVVKLSINQNFHPEGWNYDQQYLVAMTHGGKGGQAHLQVLGFMYMAVSEEEIGQQGYWQRHKLENNNRPHSNLEWISSESTHATGIRGLLMDGNLIAIGSKEVQVFANQDSETR
ncbi:hypothetical protein FGO68_gene1435 [Halteria grandinella]|uniref:Uncharacterized protein n=1 Tax=Halteria grandinella TaxID=5974 RepID=A0A8J8T8K6_HALGN|nr:hypothetical protein FGO68_gene1435 [Halteria grandinella]